MKNKQMEAKQVIEGIRKRVFSNKKTSLIGLVILAAALVAVFLGRASLSEVTALLPVVMGLFWVRDTFFELNPKT